MADASEIWVLGDETSEADYCVCSGSHPSRRKPLTERWKIYTRVDEHQVLTMDSVYVFRRNYRSNALLHYLRILHSGCGAKASIEGRHDKFISIFAYEETERNQRRRLLCLQWPPAI